MAVPPMSAIVISPVEETAPLTSIKPPSTCPCTVTSTFAFMPLVVRRVGAFALAFVNPGHGAGLTKPVP